MPNRVMLVATTIAPVSSVAFKMAIQTNPPDIVSMQGDEFSIDTNKMELLTPYLLEFQDSKYLIWKKANGSMVMEEVRL